jgi:hypothetical protein
MSRFTAAILIAVTAALTVTALAFTATIGVRQGVATTRATVDPTEMMKRAPSNLPIERPEAY